MRTRTQLRTQLLEEFDFLHSQTLERKRHKQGGAGGLPPAPSPTKPPAGHFIITHRVDSQI